MTKQREFMNDKDTIASLSKLSILYAEDEKEQREGVEKTLKLFFKNVYIADDGAKAVELFEKNNLQIVLLDFVMPHLDGYEVARKIRQTHPKIPIIIASAYNEKEKLLKAIEVQTLQYIEKPITQEKLLFAFNLALEKLTKNNLLSVKLRDNITYNYLEQKLFLEENKINLSKQEVVIVEFLLKNKGKLVQKEELLQLLPFESANDNSLRNIIYRLRKKIGENNLLTIQDLGYMIP